VKKAMNRRNKNNQEVALESIKEEQENRKRDKTRKKQSGLESGLKIREKRGEHVVKKMKIVVN